MTEYDGLSEKDRIRLLRDRCEDGLRRHYAPDSRDDAYERLEHEIGMIEHHGSAVGFLKLADMMSKIRDLGVLAGPGHGSAPSLLVAYALRITDVDPLEHDLLAERYFFSEALPIEVNVMVELSRLEAVTAALGATIRENSWLQALYEDSDVKINIYGYKALTVASEVLAGLALENVFRHPATFGPIRREDPETYNLIRAGDTMGIFMLEARSITSAILQGKPATLRDLTALMATHRPHTLDLLRELVSRMSGSCEQKVAAPGVGETLADSYGLLIYQEQLMRIAMSVGQFDGHGANRLLMAAGKRQLDVLDQLHPVFVEGTVKSGLTIVEAERLWENLIEAAPTLFLKAHAVCMATLAYRMAYLKTHYSEAFLRAADRLRLD